MASDRPPSAEENRGRRVEGLKQIARHCGWDSTTTVKKYYAEAGLPLRTLGSPRKPRYYAWTRELDAWIEGQNCSPVTADGGPAADLSSVDPAITDPVRGQPSGVAQEDVDRVPVESSSPFSGPGRRARSLLLVTTLLLAAATAVLLLRPDRELRLETSEEDHLVVRKGREVLWTDERLDATRAIVARVDEEREGAVVGLAMPPPGERNRRPQLLFLDANDGAPVAEPFLLVAGHQIFPEYANAWKPALEVLDLDGNGIDEILVTLDHAPNWPGYSVLYEPDHRRARFAYMSPGHHWLAGTHDFDGDGRPELIFLGHENGMGWSSSVAVIRLEPSLSERQTRTVPGYSPTRDFTYGPQNALLWYALLPPRSCNEGTACFEIDEGRDRIHFFQEEAGGITLDFDGFPADSISELPVHRRIEARDRAFAALRAGDRSLRAGLDAEALREFRNARIAAERAALPALQRILRTREIATLIRLGEDTEQDLRLPDEFTVGERHQRIFDIATAYHLAGRPEEAATWYRAGLDTALDEVSSGRPLWELLRGLVLVLVELDRTSEAREAIATYRHALKIDPWTRALDAFVRWRAGSTPTEDLARPGATLQSDYYRYWTLEFMAGRPEHDPEHLLELVRTDRRVNSEAAPMLMSLEAQLLRTLGRTDEGDQLALEALARAQSMARTYPVVHSHLDLVRERARVDGDGDGWLERTLADATPAPTAPVSGDSP